MFTIQYVNVKLDRKLCNLKSSFLGFSDHSEFLAACHMAHFLNLLILSIRPSINGLIVVLRGNLARRGESRRLEIGGYRQ